jgi:general secretion pathway protein G
VNKGFTLIELLVVVAIIAILAAIAYPNFMEAQTRANISRVKSDLRTIATGLESYMVDRNRVPYVGKPGGPHYGWVNAQQQLTTPISYLTM